MKDLLAIVGLYAICVKTWHLYKRHLKPTLVQAIEDAIEGDVSRS